MAEENKGAGAGDQGGAASGAGAAAAGAGAAQGADAGQATQGQQSAATLAGGGADAGKTGQDTGQAQQQVPADWPADWRERIAGDDKAYLKQLQRYGSPLDYAKKARSLEQKLSAGDYKRALPDNATDDEKAAWRKDNGLPEKVEEYVAKLALPKGMVLGEADKPVAESFAKVAHEHGLTPAQFNQAVAWYYATQDAQSAERWEKDDQNKTAVMTDLMAEWGPEFKRNSNAMHAFNQTEMRGFGNELMAARMPDGKLVGDHPQFVRWFDKTVRELRPDLYATVVPAGAGDPGKGIEGRLAELNSWMAAPQGSDNWRKYWKDDNVQAEYRKLVDAQSKMKARAA